MVCRVRKHAATRKRSARALAARAGSSNSILDGAREHAHYTHSPTRRHAEDPDTGSETAEGAPAPPTLVPELNETERRQAAKRLSISAAGRQSRRPGSGSQQRYRPRPSPRYAQSIIGRQAGGETAPPANALHMIQP